MSGDDGGSCDIINTLDSAVSFVFVKTCPQVLVKTTVVCRLPHVVAHMTSYYR